MDTAGGKRFAEVGRDGGGGAGRRGEPEVTEGDATEVNEHHTGRHGRDGDRRLVDEVDGSAAGGAEQDGGEQRAEECFHRRKEPG